MSPQAYFRIKFGDKIYITMEITELIFKDGSTFLVRYDANKNLSLLADCHSYYVTEVIFSLYKYVTDPTYLNLGIQEKHIIRWNYKLGHIIFQLLIQSSRWNIIPNKLSNIDLS